MKGYRVTFKPAPRMAEISWVRNYSLPTPEADHLRAIEVARIDYPRAYAFSFKPL